MRLIDADALEDITVTIDGTVFVRYEDIMNEPTYSKGLPPTAEISVAVGVTDGERHWKLLHTWENEPKPLTIEPKTGHWIRHGEPPWYVIECSECGAKWQMSANWDTNNYCGNCGARMESEDADK